MLYLVRHGQTPYNAERRLQGQLDIPLSDTGREQARELGERLKENGPRVKKLYCSTLSRAGETARIIGRALSLTPITAEGLEEIFFGRFQGHIFSECARLFPEAYADYLIHGSNSNAHGGETGYDVMDRARKALLKLPESANEEPALVVCHGAVIGFLRAAAEGLPLNDVRAFIPENAELCEFTPEMMERIAAYGKEQ